MSQEQRDSYVIPPNFIEGGSFFGGLFKARNVVEAVILAAGKTDKSVLKKLKKLSDERKYQSGKHGWSSIRLAVVDLDTHKVHTNRMGDSLKNILQPLV